MSNDLSRMLTALHGFVNSARSSFNRGNAQEDIENVLTLYEKDCELDGYLTGQALAAELKDYLRSNQSRESLNRSNAKEDLNGLLTAYQADCILDGYVTGQELSASLLALLTNLYGG